jgi:Uncharacterized conserved protein
MYMGFENRLEQRTSVSEEVQEPPQYRVMLLNDDYTTKDFVVAVLVAVFHKNEDDAQIIMEDVHRKGRGVVGSYTYDIASTRCLQVHEAARQNGFPLRCIMEQL